MYHLHDPPFKQLKCSVSTHDIGVPTGITVRGTDFLICTLLDDSSSISVFLLHKMKKKKDNTIAKRAKAGKKKKEFGLRGWQASYTDAGNEDHCPGLV